MEIRTSQACSTKAKGSLGFVSGSFSNLTQFSGLTNNMKKVENLAYLCHICDKAFLKHQVLQQHYQVSHGQPAPTNVTIQEREVYETMSPGISPEPGRNQLRVSDTSHHALQGGYSLDFQNKQQSSEKE